MATWARPVTHRSTDENREVTGASSLRVIELKAALDQLIETPEWFDEQPSPAEWAVYADAIRNFVAGGPELLDEATPYLWQYYRSVVNSFDEAEMNDYGIPILSNDVEIWDEVAITESPTIRLGGSRLEPGRSYISFEGEVSWEIEHGLQIVFEHGLHVCKVSPFDDHSTNAHAWGDEALLGIIFK